MGDVDTWRWWLVAALWFGAGWGWGQWWSERQVRQERQQLEAGRLTVSMPTNAEDAATTLELLSVMVRKAEEDRQSKTGGEK